MKSLIRDLTNPHFVVAERIVKSMRGLASASLLPSIIYTVCVTHYRRGFLKLTLTGPRRLESQRNVKYTFYLRQVKFFSQFKTIFCRQNMNVYLTY